MSIRRANGRIAALTLASLVVVGSCAPRSEAEPPADVAYAEPGDSMGAETSGVLRREGGCVYLDADDAIGPMVAVFPNEGIRWSGDSLAVGEHFFPLGERLQFMGGAREEVPEDTVVPQACRAELYWFISPSR